MHPHVCFQMCLKRKKKKLPGFWRQNPPKGQSEMSESGCFPKKLPTFHFSVKLQLWETVSWLKSLPVLRWRSGASTAYHFGQPGTTRTCEQWQTMIRIFDHSDFDGPMAKLINHCCFIGNISPSTFLRVFSERQNAKKNACKLTESTLGSCTMRQYHKKWDTVPPNYPKKEIPTCTPTILTPKQLFCLFSLLALPFCWVLSQKSCHVFPQFLSAKFEAAGGWRCYPLKMDMFPKKKGPFRTKISSFNHWCLGDILVFGGFIAACPTTLPSAWKSPVTRCEDVSALSIRSLQSDL